MKLRLRLICSSLIFILVLVGVFFSHHGLIEFVQFKNLIDSQQERVSFIENENRFLKARLDALDSHYNASLESHLREQLGWVKPGEIVYFEKTQ
jgi:cell division protein FtsB